MKFHKFSAPKKEIFQRLIIISVIKFLRDESVQMMHFFFEKKVSNKCDENCPILPSVVYSLVQNNRQFSQCSSIKFALFCTQEWAILVG